jgi:FkbM family methyltransferase
MSEANSLELCRTINAAQPGMRFNIFEIGALPLRKEGEPFHMLLDVFADSKIYAFEPDKDLCDTLNGAAKKGLHYFAHALGKRNESAYFYSTNHRMCSSLYRPDEALLKLYNNLDVMMISSIGTVETITLDSFCRDHGIDDVDCIKIDVQGAELDIFRGGVNCLRSVTSIISEVEFIRLYEHQPLFGDICDFLEQQKLMFHKFLGLAGRTLKPIVRNNNVNTASQHMWSDAMFMKHISILPDLADEKLLKLAIMAHIYRSADVSYYCLNIYDSRHRTALRNAVLS